MSRKRDDLLTLAAQALEFSAHAVHRRGILPLPDQLSKDAAEALAALAVQTQVDHLRQIGYTNVANLLDPSHRPPGDNLDHLEPCSPKKPETASTSLPKQPLPSNTKSPKTPKSAS